MGRFDEYLSDISEVKREIKKRQDRFEFLRGDSKGWYVVEDCWAGVLDPLISPQKRALGDITH